MKRIRSFGSLVMVMAIVLATGMNASAQTNLLANPGFEALGGSYDGWFTFGDGVQLSTPDGDNIIRTDSTAAKIYGEFTNCDIPIPQFDVGGFGQAFVSPTVGDIYELTGFSFVSSGDPLPGSTTCPDNRMIAKIVFFNATSGGAELSSNEIIIGNHASILDQWNEFSISAPCPPGAQRVEALFLFLQPGCDTGSVFVDDVAFYQTTPGTPPTELLSNPHFDGGLTGWTVFGNAFYDARNFAVRTIAGSAKLFGPFSEPGAASGMYQAFTGIAEGTDLEFGVYSMTTCVESPLNDGNDNIGYAKMVYKDAAGAEIGFDEVIIADSTSALGTWVHNTVTGTVPTGTDTVEAYILFVQTTAEGGAFWVDDASLVEVTGTGIGDDQMPRISSLYQNVPNPFNPSTRIDFNLDKAATVEVKIYDVTGRLVATLFEGHREAGLHSLNWDGRTASGSIAASGVYYYTLKTGSELQTRKMVLMR